MLMPPGNPGLHSAQLDPKCGDGFKRSNHLPSKHPDGHCHGEDTASAERPEYPRVQRSRVIAQNDVFPVLDALYALENGVSFGIAGTGRVVSVQRQIGKTLLHEHR